MDASWPGTYRRMTIPRGETGHGAAWAYSGTATAVNVVSGVCGLVKRALTR